MYYFLFFLEYVIINTVVRGLQYLNFTRSASVTDSVVEVDGLMDDM